ncbi:Tripartite tricarboxylate transporter TctB family protein [Vibrio aerogenes CECT 7868]|uniref:Tripartite tricarboxylate transporter TctB family protein n=1 Tax=Vibrio aerogenes CECT 7868 TaxID=1216006 RepID=A0A1M6C7K1_9VIBR|nr:tripartite tricarboxylate transporter TctB family protein [Vibrio aerogenes]SHI56791.1 Tripartite tricarboxylate transporter TctB family protein [Vibrio aerogenes CECT 7868]
MTTRTRKPGELVFNGLTVILSFFLVVQSSQISGFTAWSAPGFFPVLASLIMLVASVFSFVRSCRISPPTLPMISFWRRVLPRQIIIMMISVIAFAFALSLVGFLPASLVFLFVTIKIFHGTNGVKTLLISVVSLAVIYLIFRGVFQVILPESEWLTQLTGFEV